MESCQHALQCGFLKVAVGNMRYWDCSKGKNTAHMFAIKECGLQQMLINLDGDNIIKEAWLPWLFNMLSQNTNSSGAHRYKGDDGGCTGRVSMKAQVFKDINGYDEAMPYPSGYEDIEIVQRCQVHTGEETKIWGKQKAYPGCGYSIPNDADQIVALGEAKVRNCDPDRCGNLSWGQQNGKNMNYYEKLKGRQPKEHHGSFSSSVRP